MLSAARLPQVRAEACVAGELCEIGVNFHILFQSVINITTQLGRRDMKLFSTVILIETGSKTHEKSVNENR